MNSDSLDSLTPVTGKSVLVTSSELGVFCLTSSVLWTQYFSFLFKMSNMNSEEELLEESSSPALVGASSALTMEEVEVPESSGSFTNSITVSFSSQTELFERISTLRSNMVFLGCWVLIFEEKNGSFCFLLSIVCLTRKPHLHSWIFFKKY